MNALLMNEGGRWCCVKAASVVVMSLLRGRQGCVLEGTGYVHYLMDWLSAGAAVPLGPPAIGQAPLPNRLHCGHQKPPRPPAPPPAPFVADNSTARSHELCPGVSTE